MPTHTGLSEDEERALELISQQDGVYQSQLWKGLGVSSRKGSRLATSLAESGAIERQEAVHDGQRTYLLTATEQPHEFDSEPGAGPRDQDALSGQQRKNGLKSREPQALELITSTGGIYQSAMWKELDIDSRVGRRIATALEAKGLIEREEAVHNGQRTYFLKPPKRDVDFSVLMAGDELSPFIESEDLDAQASAFTQWLLLLEEDYVAEGS